MKNFKINAIRLRENLAAVPSPAGNYELEKPTAFLPRECELFLLKA